MKNVSSEAISPWVWNIANDTAKWDDEIFLWKYIQYYTQLVWANTAEVGCGLLTSRKLTFDKDIARAANSTLDYVETVSNIVLSIPR